VPLGVSAEHGRNDEREPVADRRTGLTVAPVWEHVMLRPDRVRQVVKETVARLDTERS
jgi:hypothetical protein